MNKDLLTPYTFEKYVAYKPIPVLYFEAMCDCYIDNPYVGEQPEHEYPNIIILLDQSAEVWADKSKRKILRTDEEIQEIVDANVSITDEYRSYVSSVAEKNDWTREGLVEAVNKMNDIIAHLYHAFVFFTDECFEPENERWVEELPEVRWKVSEFMEGIGYGAYESILNGITEVTGVSRDILDHAHTEELLALLDQASELPSDITGRPIAIAVFNNSRFIETGEDARELISFLNQNDPYQDLVEDACRKGEVRGTTAHKGAVTGRVVKLLEGQYSDFKSVLEGEEDYILVTPMTRPEIVPYLKAAKGIVTDEGGITCHAAIISRELGKPCIIGTKIATRVLEDGMRIEMDADNGIVTIVE